MKHCDWPYLYYVHSLSFYLILSHVQYDTQLSASSSWIQMFAYDFLRFYFLVYPRIYCLRRLGEVHIVSCRIKDGWIVDVAYS
jgi:hypothetical protein